VTWQDYEADLGRNLEILHGKVLPFHHPKLAVILSASTSGKDFGEALERARQRLAEGSKPTAGPMVIKPPPPPPRPRLPK
jgi:hypothetical protein